MTIEKKYELFEQYLSGTLTGEALSSFERQLQADKSLQQELELHQQIAETLKGEKAHELRDVLTTVDQQWQSPQPGTAAKHKTFQLRRIVAIAATILLLVFAYQIFMPFGNKTNEQLFADHFEPYQMILAQRTHSEEATEITDAINNAVAAYENKKFAEASAAFQRLQAETPDAELFRFYIAVSELSLGNSAKAISMFKELLEETPSLFTEQSRWYLAMAYLQQGERDAAKKQLENIFVGAYKYNEAQQLLRHL